MAETLTIRPQPGPQETFLSTSADIAVYGGAAGGGKTWALLLEPLRHIANPHFGGVVFRRTFPQITNEGALWDESQTLYPLAGGQARQSSLEWTFPSGASIRFAHLQHEQSKFDWQGSQIPFVAFDELTHFTRSQFLYVGLSRGRSLCGVKPYVRATCNPDANSWVKEFLAPWVDSTFPDPAASGEVRWFLNDAGTMVWVPPGTPDAKSLTFVRASVWDNKVLLARNPEYLSNLKALDAVERRRLLDGDWDVVEEGELFHREWFGVVERAPEGLRQVRAWDLASTEEGGDYTVGVLMGRAGDGTHYIIDVIRVQKSPALVEEIIRGTAGIDGRGTAIVIEQEPGSSGKFVADDFARRVLAGYEFHTKPSTGSKPERARPYSAAVENGLVKLLRGHWNRAFIDEHCAFPNPSAHDDQVDAASLAFAAHSQRKEITFSWA